VYALRQGARPIGTLEDGGVTGFQKTNRHAKFVGLVARIDTEAVNHDR
jgi:hypothetical protein